MRLEALILCSLQRKPHKGLTRESAPREEHLGWLTQFGAMRAQPLASFAIPRTGRCDEPPVRRRVIEPFQMHQLVDHHVVAHPGRHRDEAPVEAHVTVATA